MDGDANSCELAVQDPSCHTVPFDETWVIEWLSSVEVCNRESDLGRHDAIQLELKIVVKYLFTLKYAYVWVGS